MASDDFSDIEEVCVDVIGSEDADGTSDPTNASGITVAQDPCAPVKTRNQQKGERWGLEAAPLC